jgi:hypothetical protein
MANPGFIRRATLWKHRHEDDSTKSKVVSIEAKQMKYEAKDYTFLGLSSNGVELESPLKSLAYLVGLVDTAKNEVTDSKKAYFVLGCLFDIEEQVGSYSELISLQENDFPAGFWPQTPVMVTTQWSPISALLEKDWEPLVLSRQSQRWACASGVWRPKQVEAAKPYTECKTPEELFWSILKEVVEKAQAREQLISVIACPGWSYANNLRSPQNLNLVEAEKADRVIWQRTPRPRRQAMPMRFNK